MNKLIAAAAAIVVSIAAPATASAGNDDALATNITTLEAAAPAICEGVANALAAGQEPSDFVEPAVDEFVAAYSNAVGIDELAATYRGILVGCAAR